jgi:hypothetical protein
MGMPNIFDGGDDDDEGWISNDNLLVLASTVTEWRSALQARQVIAQGSQH